MVVSGSRLIPISIGAAVVFLGFVIFIFALHADKPGGDQRITSFSYGEYAPDHGVDWSFVTLPDDWYRDSRYIEEAWYRFEFDLEVLPIELNALYFPALSQNLSVYLNGIEVGNGGSMEKPIARNWPRPLLFPVAPEFLQTERNEILIRVVSEPPGRGLLGKFYLGDRKALLPFYSSRSLLKGTVPMVITVVLIIFSVLLMSITLRRPSDSQYAWGGACLLGLAAHSLPMLTQLLPISSLFWEWWQHSSIGFTAVFITVFIHRFLDMRKVRLELAAGCVVLVASILGLLVGSFGYQATYFQNAGAFWGLLSIAIGAIPLCTLISALLAHPDIRKIVLLGAGAALFLFGAHDALFVMGYLSRQNGYLIHYASPLVTTVFASILFLRFADTSREADELNRNLENRVEAKSRELADTYERLMQLEQQQILAQERERFNRDIHDGLGGYLAGALAMAESSSGNSSALATTLRDATDEMRLMLDSAEAHGDDLGMILGNIRPKLERQLKQSGFTLTWYINETAPIEFLGPSAVVQVVRIVQESVNNSMKHSGGNHVCVSLQDTSDNTVQLDISDNGTCDSTTRIGGRGMSNIRARALQVNARVTIIPAGKLGGCTISIVFDGARDAEHASLIVRNAG